MAHEAIASLLVGLNAAFYGGLLIWWGYWQNKARRIEKTRKGRHA